MKTAWLVLAAVLLAACRGEPPDLRKGGKDGEKTKPAAQFEPAAPFQLSKDLGRHNQKPDATRNEVRIVFDPDSSAARDCREIVLIQALQIFVDGRPIRPGDYSKIDKLAGNPDPESWAIDDLPATAGVDETGTFIDSKAPPAAHGSKAGLKTPPGKTAKGLPLPAEEVDATLDDPPLAEGGDRGFRDAAHPNGYREVLWKFETCAYCNAGAEQGRYYGCIAWEHVRTADDAATKGRGRSRFTGQGAEPSPGFRAAYDRFKQRYP